ncbi:cysteine ABC transporter substrate-binding protein [Helicobacter mustelae]|uniref:Putative amino-acid transporter periplasmic solute-binding protein n=1 Tax=Helicobacter mustelae (strain ATCC 43772 / CCUG 25715 / CIP 103759 / LMG 18044 / NCTC 12198 / R85-136P) TaxID=679897 RepID=D3UGJ1_HELM1|nr:cysteine ABC transporter substrate-binding protein [Helicobacter mustelae]CBG39612.1 putative amino-acid transporter periplasmic solute-binding protein [Helicobacter mustelae 12198]SQH71124.1 amino acid transporter periplasmic solute-binding protein [Helicobacter mustelae]STP12252.1 amino acid transporter periplasmic solute-binding protein [Helicobacter mustelae]
MKKFAFLFIIFMTMMFWGCSSDKEKQSNFDLIKQKGVLRVGVFSDKPPFGYVDAKGEFDGFDVYIAKRIAKDLLGEKGRVEFYPVEAAARIEFLKSGKVDLIMANFTKTKERAEVVDFAKPYMKVSLGVVSKNGEITTISQLKDQTLIVDRGTTADFYFSKNHPEVKLLKYDQNTEAFLALKSDRGVALAHDNTLLFAWAKQNPPFAVGIAELGNQDVIAPAIVKGDAKFLDWLNQEITKLTKEGFMKQAYDATLKPAYGNSVDPDSVIFEK